MPLNKNLSLSSDKLKLVNISEIAPCDMYTTLMKEFGRVLSFNHLCSNPACLINFEIVPIPKTDDVLFISIVDDGQ